MKRFISILAAVLMVLTVAPLSSLTDLDLSGFFGVTEAEASTTMGDLVATKSVGDTIEFGSYPQSEVTDSSLISALNSRSGIWVSYGYYTSNGNYYPVQSDYMKYKDVTYNGNKYRAVTFSSYRPYETFFSSSAGNSYQDDNGYTTGNVYWFKYEPLTWKILDPSTGLVLCTNIIDSGDYYYSTSDRIINGKTVYQNNWEYSTIRTWLNDTFYNTAFTADQQSAIAITTIQNPAYDSYYSQYNANATGDKIYLLSYEDMLNTSYGFSSGTGGDINRRAHASDYAKSQGIYVDEEYKDSDGEYTSYYHCRSAGSFSDYTTGVDPNGDVGLIWSTYTIIHGIRPALNFNSSSTHTHSYTSKTVSKTYLKSAATCQSPAVYYYKCANCSAKGTKTYSYGSKAAHSYTSKTQTATYAKKAATCTSGGTYYYKCANCSAKGTKTYTGTKLGHSYTSKTTTTTYLKSAATCTKAAVYYYKCSRCSAKGTNTYTYGSKAAHSYTSKTATKTYLKSAATCTKAAVYYYKCSRCSAKGTKTYTYGSAFGHNYKTTTTEATLSGNGSIIKKCSRCGNVASKTIIYYPKTFTLSKTSCTCTGSAIKPTVTVKDSKGNKIAASDYTVTYSNNTNPGTAKAKITFRGNYSGTKTLTYKITLGKVKVTSAAMKSGTYNVSVKWNKVAGAEGYEIYYYNNNHEKYEKLLTTAVTSYSKTWPDWQTVKLKIRAVCGSTKGPWSDVITLNHKG